MNEVRIAVLGSFNIDLLPRYLGPELEQVGLNPEFYTGGFAQYQQETLNENSGYFGFDPDITILFLEGQDLFQDLCRHPLDYTEEIALERAHQELQNVESIIHRISQKIPGCTVFLNNTVPPSTALGSLDGNSDYSVKAAFRAYNVGIERLAKDLPTLFIVDYESLVNRVGRDNWSDERMWYLAKMPLNGNALGHSATLFASYIKALKGLTKKCLVVDLDNTLWGGIIGEDGIDGIELGTDGTGLAYRDFQNEILNLSKRGIILAVSSKNNQEEAFEALENHPDMVLRTKYFASMKIDWRDKAVHLREIADELNIGLDSFVFLDDSSFERSLIESQLPEVTVVNLPEDPSLYRRTLLQLDVFDTLTITEEDQKRGQLYREQTLRVKLSQNSSSLEEFYESLGMEAVVKTADSFAIPRIAQLTQKTNQFNLTTRRYTESEIQSISNTAEHDVYYLQLLDKFGDNGIVGVAVVETKESTCTIDAFLLSCRAMGRTVETAFLGHILEEAKKAGATRVCGKYFPTKKNSVVKDFYEQHGFEKIPEAADSWRLDLAQQSVTVPPWIKITAAA